MGFDVMNAWSRRTFEFNDHIQRRGDSWKGQFSFDSDTGHSFIHPDYELPPSPSATAQNAPSFAAARSRWSPPGSPSRARSLRQSPEPISTENSAPASPRIDSAHPLDSPSPKSPLSPKDQHSLADKLYAASCAGDLPHIRLLLALGAPVNMPTMVDGLYDAFKPPKSGCLSSLAGAAGSQQLAAVKLLLASGAALNPTMKASSSSPLHQACKADDAEMTEFLLAAGADVDAFNAFNTTPLMYAAKYGSPALVEAVLAYKPALHTVSFIRTAAVHWAVWPGRPEVMHPILAAGADPNHAMGDGSTPLHCAALAGLGQIAECLLRAGADARRKDGEGRTPAQVADESGFGELAGMLRRAEGMRR